MNQIVNTLIERALKTPPDKELELTIEEFDRLRLDAPQGAFNLNALAVDELPPFYGRRLKINLP